MKKISILFFCFLLCSISNAYSANIYSNFEGVEFGFRYLNSKHYDENRIHINGAHTIGAHNISYKFAHDWNDETLTTIGAGYAYREGPHWLGFNISSAGNEPFSDFNLIDFSVFYAFRLFQNVVRYTDGNEGDQIPHYSRFYLGLDWSTERLLLDGYPLPVIRYEYDGPAFYLILGFPLTYAKIYIAQNQSLEIQYKPLLNFLVSYNIHIDKNNKISFQLDIEQKQYKISDIDKNKYFHSQTKYYTEYYWLKLKYSLSLAENKVALSPYAALLLDGKRYWGKSASDRKSTSSMGLGLGLGINLTLKF